MMEPIGTKGIDLDEVAKIHGTSWGGGEVVWI